jgi:hypothetical protein
MKKLIFLLLFALGTVFAQTDTPNYDKYSVTVSAGSDLWRSPFAPKFTGGVQVGYKFAENYKKFFDTTYASVMFTGNTRTDAMTYHVGVQRTMMNDRDRMGLLFKVEGGATTLFGYRDVTKPSVAAGIGLGFDFSGSPYPAWMNHTVLSLVPMTNKVVSFPVYETLTLSFTKTFK